MEIKIGVRHTGREIQVETEQSFEDILSAWKHAAETSSLFVVDAVKGRRLILAGQEIAYIDIATEHPRPVGFGFSE